MRYTTASSVGLSALSIAKPLTPSLNTRNVHRQSDSASQPSRRRSDRPTTVSQTDAKTSLRHLLETRKGDASSSGDKFIKSLDDLHETWHTSFATRHPSRRVTTGSIIPTATRGGKIYYSFPTYITTTPEKVSASSLLRLPLAHGGSADAAQTEKSDSQESHRDSSTTSISGSTIRASTCSSVSKPQSKSTRRSLLPGINRFISSPHFDPPTC